MTKQTFKELYLSLDTMGRIEFANKITSLCLVSHNTVESWVYTSRKPSLLAQKIIAENLKTSAEELFN